MNNPSHVGAPDALQDLHNELYRAQRTENVEVLMESVGKARLLLARYRDALAASTSNAWPKYIASIIETYIKQNRTEEDRETGIAKIIERRLYSLAAPGASIAARESFQQRVKPWLLECFGEAIANDREERNHRFLEEALELVQACGCTASEAHQLVEYTFGRPVGEKAQEVGGVMVTLAALCLAQDLDMHAEGETELARISVPGIVAKIRAKQAAKPKHSPLPAAPATCRLDDGQCGICGGDWSMCGCEGMLRRSAAAPEPDDTPLETGEADAR